MLMTLWKDDEKYQNTYWRKFDGNIYFTGDYALCDTDGYLWLLGRSDDVLKIAGHRLGTVELESAFVSHRAIAEAAVARCDTNALSNSTVPSLCPAILSTSSDLPSNQR